MCLLVGLDRSLLSSVNTWITELQRLLTQHDCVLVTLHQIMGSAPRESGCRMIVTTDSISGSIGGGNLEFTAIAQARQMLNESHGAAQLQQPFGLGPALNQCCGGAVNLHFERIPNGQVQWLDDLIAAQSAASPIILVSAVDAVEPTHHVIQENSNQPENLPDAIWLAARELMQTPVVARITNNSHTVLETDKGNWCLERIEDQQPQLYLFGAGHVGQEVARMLRGLPFKFSWIDQRPDVFPAEAAEYCTLIGSDPVATVAQAKRDSIFVVMTHSHQLDEDICHAILQRQDTNWEFRWLGLIGSATKRKRFVHRLQQRDITAAQLQRLVCPVGLSGIHGKQPATIALSLMAQLMMESTWTAAEN